MKKGQISLDLMLTLIIALIIIASFSYIITNYNSGKEKMLTENQLKMTSSKTAALITTTQALYDTNFAISEKISKIKFVDSNGNNLQIYPKITINSDKNTLSASIQLNGETISYDNNFYASGGTIIDTAEVETSGVLVIKNE